MKIPSLTRFAVALIGLGLVVPAAIAVPITYTFVATSVPAGTTIAATVSIDSSVTGVFSGVGNLLAFNATISGNGTTTVNRTWSLGEVSFAQGTINSGVLAFSGLQATDSALISGSSLNSFLNGGATGFSAPVTIGGSWQRVAAAVGVPDGGPGLAGLLLLAAVAVFGSRARRKQPIPA